MNTLFSISILSSNAIEEIGLCAIERTEMVQNQFEEHKLKVSRT